MSFTDTVIILAAGRGTRLRPLTDTLPKPLLDFKETTLLGNVLNNIPKTIRNVIIIINYKKEMIESYIKNNFMHFHAPITCIQQIDTMKGTLGAVYSAKDFLKQNNITSFVVLNADDLYHHDDIVKLQKSPLYTFGLFKKYMYHYLGFALGTDNSITQTYTISDDSSNRNHLVATGAYHIDFHIFDYDPIMISGNEYGLPQTLLHQKNIPLYGQIMTTWTSVNTLDDYYNL